MPCRLHACLCALMEHVDERPAPSPDRMAIAAISGIVSRHATRLAVWGKPSPAEIGAAVAELAERGYTSRPDLLAEWAGIRTGAESVRGISLDVAVAEAAILVAAGADEWVIDGWAAVGAERAARAALAPPQSGPGRPSRAPRQQPGTPVAA